MYLAKEIDVLTEALRENSYFDNVKIVKAYPYLNKATRLSKTVIAISPAGIDAKNISIGDENLFGDYSIAFDVFIPIQSGSPIESSVIEQLLVTMSKCYPVGISVSEISVNNDISCCTAKCIFTFNGEIGIGG
jgi:hypothetical protein